LLSLACSAAKPAPSAAAPVASIAALQPTAAPAPGPAAAPLPQTPGSDADAGGVVHWKGSRVSLWAPKAMRRPTRLQYLRQDDPLIVVAVAELTARDPAETKSMLAGAARGAAVSDEKPVKRGNAQGFSGQAAPDITGLSRRVVALADGPAVTVVIVQYQAAAASVADKISESVTLDGSQSLDPLALNGIKIGDDAGFSVSDAASHPVTFFEKGKPTPLRPGEPLFELLSVPYPKPDTSDRELGALLGVTLGHYAPDMSKANLNSFEISHGPAFVMSVPGKADGVAVGLYAFIVRRPDTAFIGFGHVRPLAMKDVAPRFERLVKSIELDDSVFSPGIASETVKKSQ